MDSETRSTIAALAPLALLSAASGARTMTGVAALVPNRATKALAASEIVADKIPGIPDRIDPAALLGRVAAGAVIGAVIGGRAGIHRGVAALAGGLISFASAHATYRLRRTLAERLPATAAAVIEDAIVVAAAAAGTSLLPERPTTARIH